MDCGRMDNKVAENKGGIDDPDSGVHLSVRIKLADQLDCWTSTTLDSR